MSRSLKISPVSLKHVPWSRCIFLAVNIVLFVFAIVLEDAPTFIPFVLIPLALIGVNWLFINLNLRRSCVLTLHPDRFEWQSIRRVQTVHYSEITQIEQYLVQGEIRSLEVTIGSGPKRLMITGVSNMAQVKAHLTANAPKAKLKTRKRAFQLTDSAGYVASYFFSVAILWFVLSISLFYVTFLALQAHLLLQAPLWMQERTNWSKRDIQGVSAIFILLFSFFAWILMVRSSNELKSVSDICSNMQRFIYQSGCIEQLAQRDSTYASAADEEWRVDIRRQGSRTLFNEADGIFLRPQEDNIPIWRDTRADIIAERSTHDWVISADGESFYQFAGLYNKRVSRYSTTTGQQLAQWDVPNVYLSSELTVNSAETWLIVGDTIISTEDNAVFTLDADKVQHLDGNGVFVYINDDYQIESITLPSETVQPLDIGPTERILDFMLNPDRSQIAVCDVLAKLHLFDIATGTLLHTFDEIDDCNASFFADESRLLLCHRGGDTGHDVRIYDAITFEEQSQLQLATCDNMALSADGTQLATFTEQQVVIWNVEAAPTVTHTFVLNDHSTGSGTFSADGTRLAVQRTRGRTAIFDLTR